MVHSDQNPSALCDPLARHKRRKPAEKRDYFRRRVETMN